jgi:hypothetical protein
MKSPFIIKVNWFLEDEFKYGFVMDLMQYDLKVLLQKNKKLPED